MLAQLVCLDRRYQRMNCFNIRELQTLLKNRYHPELLDEKLHTDFLSQTVLHTRFKLFDLSVINPKMSLFSEFSALRTTSSSTQPTINISGSTSQQLYPTYSNTNLITNCFTTNFILNTSNGYVYRVAAFVTNPLSLVKSTSLLTKDISATQAKQNSMVGNFNLNLLLDLIRFE